jgi:four helix bundle protein
MNKGYKELKVWHKAYSFTLDVYKITKSYPKEETYGLTDQMRRSSISIIANIAEGCAKQHTKDFMKFITIAIGSSNELEVYIRLSYDLNYIKKDVFENLKSNHDEISKMLFGLRKSLKLKTSN